MVKTNIKKNEQRRKKALESELNEIFNESEKLRKRRLELLSKLGEKEIDTEYNFITSDGSKKSLAELFGDQKYLFTIHNMGKHCSYCTMWADGFNDTYKYIQKKGAFVLISPMIMIHKRNLQIQEGGHL